MMDEAVKAFGVKEGPCCSEKCPRGEGWMKQLQNRLTNEQPWQTQTPHWPRGWQAPHGSELLYPFKNNHLTKIGMLVIDISYEYFSKEKHLSSTEIVRH